MTLTALLNRTCTIIRRSESGSTDELGNEIPDEEAVETVCELQQRNRSEQGNQGEVSSTDWLLILPADTDIGTGDAVVVDEEVYEMVGDPWPARNPRTATESHVEASLRRVVGDEDAS